MTVVNVGFGSLMLSNIVLYTLAESFAIASFADSWQQANIQTSFSMEAVFVSKHSWRTIWSARLLLRGVSEL